jgi:predicted transcriptional regulator
MIKSENKIKELTETLNKDSNIVITAAIELLRQEKPFEGAIGVLTAFYDRTNDTSLRRTIAGFMNDLKDQSVCQEVIHEIRKQWKSDTISMLVSSCWQSGLNYSAYSLDLAKVFLYGDYITAIECLTVIEESVPEMSKETKDKIMKMLEESPVSHFAEKKELASELVAVLER